METMNDDFTSIKFPWNKEVPMIILTFYFFTVLVLTLANYNLIILWIERIFYWNDMNQIYALNNILDQDRSEMEIEVSSYKFKAPGLIRKITSTYFKKSKKEDMKIIKQRVDKLIKKYKNRHSRHSIDLENMMRDRDLEAPRNANIQAEETKINNTSMMSNIGKL